MSTEHRAPTRLWAPYGRAVDIVVDEHPPFRLLRDGQGVHTGDVPGLGRAGARYGFVIDGKPAVPDPRSRSQPDGVHGRSEVVIVEDFPWTDSAFKARPFDTTAVIYELHVGTFTDDGTFDSAIAKLDHLADLGVSHIELMPIAAFPGERGWGYDGVSLYAAHARYGGALGLCRFVDAAHARGLAVVLDVVYNHLGPDGNYLGAQGPYFTHLHHTPWGEAVNFDDEGSDEVRAFVLDNARMWLSEFHLDGLRLDAVHAIHDHRATTILESLATQTATMSQQQQRELVLIAESDFNDPATVRPVDEHGVGMTAQWFDDFHHALHVALTNERHGYYVDFHGIDDLVTALTKGFVYVGQHSAVRRRGHGRPWQGPGRRLVTYTQNHDQVGNRAHGERLAALVGNERARVGLLLLLTSPFVPMLFAGEEWGATTPFLYFTDHTDEDLANGVREGRRREFGLNDLADPQAVSTFDDSRLRWSDLDRADHAATLSFTRDLLRLRRTIADLHDDDVSAVVIDHHDGAFVVRRGRARVVVNLGPPTRAALDVAGLSVAFATRPDVVVEGDSVLLPTDSAAILLPTA